MLDLVTLFKLYTYGLVKSYDCLPHCLLIASGSSRQYTQLLNKCNKRINHGVPDMIQ